MKESSKNPWRPGDVKSGMCGADPFEWPPSASTFNPLSFPPETKTDETIISAVDAVAHWASGPEDDKCKK